MGRYIQEDPTLTWPVEIGSMSFQKHILQDKRILDIWRTGLHKRSSNPQPSHPPPTTHTNRSAKHRRILSTHHITQHLFWQFCTPSSHWRILFAIFMLIAPLIREPGRVVSTGRALVPTQPNFNDLFNFDGMWALCDWRCLDIVRQVDPWYCYSRIYLRGVMKLRLTLSLWYLRPECTSSTRISLINKQVAHVAQFRSRIIPDRLFSDHCKMKSSMEILKFYFMLM
jgi:hypothetical protein